MNEVIGVAPQVSDVRVERSSLLMLGLGDPSEEVREALIVALAATLGVNTTRLSILSLSPVLDSNARRLRSGLFVTFEVITTASIRIDAFGATTTAAAANLDDLDVVDSGAPSEDLSAALPLADLRPNSEAFLVELSVALEERGLPVPPGTLQVESWGPVSIERFVAARAAGPWGQCCFIGNLTACVHVACGALPGFRRRAIYCVSVANTSEGLRDVFCQGLPELPGEEVCSGKDNAECQEDDGNKTMTTTIVWVLLPTAFLACCACVACAIIRRRRVANPPLHVSHLNDLGVVAPMTVDNNSSASDNAIAASDDSI